MKARLRFCAIVLANAFVLSSGISACGKKQPPKEPPITETIADAGPEDAADAADAAPRTLYDRLGGKDGVTAVVESFTKNLLQNDTTKKRFAKLPKDRIEKFKANLVAQICNGTGGGCEYTGKNMRDAHKNMHISEAEWNATILALKAAFEENKVGDAEQSELVGILGDMKPDVMGKKK